MGNEPACFDSSTSSPRQTVSTGLRRRSIVSNPPANRGASFTRTSFRKRAGITCGTPPTYQTAIPRYFCDESADGSTWTTHHKTAAFPASRESKLFDGRYTSTPCRAGRKRSISVVLFRPRSIKRLHRRRRQEAQRRGWSLSTHRRCRLSEAVVRVSMFLGTTL